MVARLMQLTARLRALSEFSPVDYAVVSLSVDKPQGGKRWFFLFVSFLKVLL